MARNGAALRPTSALRDDSHEATAKFRFAVPKVSFERQDTEISERRQVGRPRDNCFACKKPMGLFGRDLGEAGIIILYVKTVGIINPLEQTYIIIGHQEAEQFNYPGLRHKGQATFK